MTRRLARALLMVLVVCTAGRSLAQQPATTAFSFQGRLLTSGVGQSALFDFQFKLYDALTAGTQQGSTLTLTNVQVTNGLFTVTLDFGQQFINQRRWLDIAVRPAATGSYTNLSPRQEVTAAPHAEGLVLPISGSVANSGPLASLINTTGDGLHSTGGYNGLYSTATTSSGNGIYAECNVGTAAYGVWGNSSTGYGVVGDGGLYGVYGYGTSYGVYGNSSSYGGFFNGVVGVEGQSASAGLGGVAIRANNTNSSGIGFWSTTSSNDSNIVLTNSGTGDLIRGFSGPSGGNLVFQVLNNGFTIVSAIQIAGGADLSEQFEVRAADSSEPAPGMVVCIDPENPGHLIVSRHAYDRTVAGIISGAGGIKTGMTMGQKDSVADGAHPVALTGRVYVYADASSGAIEPGDLLTTSDVPGHAMKVTSYDQAHGATIGKAMTSLKERRGLVLVLVTLQ